MPTPEHRTSARHATPHDHDAIVALSARLESDTLPCSLWGLTGLRFEEWLADPGRVILAAEVDGTVTAIASYQRGGPYQEHMAEVSVAVHPDHRRAGVAAHLLSALEDSARKVGVELLKALVQVENEPSRRLFERCGFEHRATLYGEFRSERFGEIDDCVYYKRLSSA